MRDRATAAVVERLKKRLWGVGDYDLELFPAVEDVYGVLLGWPYTIVAALKSGCTL
ncbi:hypothetical protein [Streptomyces lydicus]|uniref:hypothetical protein n=1 Tax=Streptomyces lydicus TaxID=47763 RepID=UPI0013E9258E|nr:hypothetical protein [Streptomyces lydicus]MCZ1012121.1 hypothetical protein [Streptomyces lydicus]